MSALSDPQNQEIVAYYRGPCCVLALESAERDGLTRQSPRSILTAMLPRRLFRLQAFALLALMVALTSGVPSHHHGEAGRVPILVDAGHHGHGIHLVDQADRLTSDGVVAALPASRLVEVGGLAPVIVSTDVPPVRPVATGRAPPSDQPRAPPVSV